MPPTAIVDHPIYREHKPGPSHPEAPARCEAALHGIKQAVPQEHLAYLRPRKASEDEIAYCHTREYIEIVKLDIADDVRCLRTGDTDLSDRSLDAALMAAGGVISAADAVMKGEVQNAFCIVRPPGHHATPDRGMGFCIFNSVAIAARHVQRAHGIERVLIVDWDVHHGNGTQDIFYEDPSVFYFSTHQWPLYPGTGLADQKGRAEGNGTTLNCPVATGAGGKDVIAAFKQRLMPAMREFRPQFIFISAGFDGHVQDPLAGLALRDEDYASLTDLMVELAEEYAATRLVSALEGGYNLVALASSVGAHVAELARLR